MSASMEKQYSAATNNQYPTYVKCSDFNKADSHKNCIVETAYSIMYKGDSISVVTSVPSSSALPGQFLVRRGDTIVTLTGKVVVSTENVDFAFFQQVFIKNPF